MSLFNHVFSFGAMRSAIWRLWYPYVTRRLRGEEVLFLNYGFETEPPMSLKLSPADEPNRACIQLYHHVATQAELAGKHVLEVSCGHGGGASYLARTLRPATCTGIDLNPAGILLCEQRHKVEGLSFFRGDAEALPFASETVDVVINVEASHCYGQFPQFLQEVVRVLRPGGYFLYADFRFSSELSEWELALARAPLEQIRAQVISAEVLRGLDRNAARSQDLLARHLPKWLQGPGRDFAGLPGSYVYSALQGGKAVYRSYCYQKPLSAGSKAPFPT
jgi:ubiquinone/menaquinone biosynthesis C-methylase UbiE